MSNQSFKFGATLERLHAGPLGQYVDAFAARLAAQGFASFSIKYRMRLVGALSRWMCRREVSLGDLDEQTTGNFLQCLRRKRRIQLGDAPTLRFLLEHLRQAGLISLAPLGADDSELGRIERGFAEYLARERGLSKASVAKDRSRGVFDAKEVPARGIAEGNWPVGSTI